MQITIYKITNTLDGKSYIGQTKNLPKRLREHRQRKSCCLYLKNAIKKHGWENFRVSVLEKCDESISPERELYHIVNSKTLAPYGYNLVLETSQGRKFHSQTRKKMSESSQKRIRKASGFHGVRRRGSVFETRITHKNKTYTCFNKDETTAAQDYDILALHFFGASARLNFPIVAHATDKEIKERATYLLTPRPKTSKYKNVAFHKASGKWRAYKYINGHQKSLGLFISERKAYKATLQN